VQCDSVLRRSAFQHHAGVGANRTDLAFGEMSGNVDGVVKIVTNRHDDALAKDTPFALAMSADAVFDRALCHLSAPGGNLFRV
jgi:hypothetical protein